MECSVGDCPHVGIVLLNWNQAEDTLACLESLEALDYPSYEVVLVDNGSVDGSPARIRQRFSEVHVIENGSNLGFAAGNNVGIAYLIEHRADYVLLLNNDTEVSPDFLSALIDVGESGSEIGVLGPKIYYYHPSRVIWSAGGWVDRYGQSGHLRADEPDDGAPESVRDVDYVTGCAILVKREVVERIGFLDERFFIYFEETEWCARARRAGFRVTYVPQAHVWHKIQQSARNESPRYLYLMSRNRLLYLRCSGAGPVALLMASLNLLRAACAWAIRPKYRSKRPLSAAVVYAVRDFAMGRFGAPPALP